MGVGHLVAGVALLAVGGNLAVEAITGLIAADHPTIGSVRLFAVNRRVRKLEKERERIKSTLR